MSYEITLASSAQREINRLPPRVYHALHVFLTQVLPENPQRVGKPLHGVWGGYHSARRGDYRILYRIDEKAEAVLVVRIDHRATIYRHS